MSKLTNTIKSLAKVTPCGYQAGAMPATEPTAWAAMALANTEQTNAARRCTDWLAGVQGRDGSVGVSAAQATPAWPTSLSILAWLSVDPSAYQESIERAVSWAIAAKGRTTSRKKQIGHDTTLVGWSWAADTHSWLEPTAMFVVALRAAGYGDHPRVREGVRLLADRLLPSGGANYGNTLVLGQELLPHVQPTGLVLWALAGESVDDPRLARSIQYLQQAISTQTTTASLAYAVLGLTAHGACPSDADHWLAAAVEQELVSGKSPYKLALLAASQSAPAQQLAVADV